MTIHTLGGICLGATLSFFLLADGFEISQGRMMHSVDVQLALVVMGILFVVTSHLVEESGPQTT
jgi:hypothetical protein